VTISFLISDYLRKAKDGDDNVLLFSRPARLTPASRRDQIMIIVDILTFTQKPARRKTILRYLNLSQYQLKKYLRFLMAKGFLAEEVGESRTYKITEKGVELVNLLEGEAIRGGDGN
jgi:predicted transcriptional regulator